MTLEDAYVGYTMGRVTLRVGPQLLNWSAADAFQPSDIINSRNYDSDFENLEKLGEPMVEMQVRVLQGALNLYYMPYRVEPKLAPESSRLTFVPAAFSLGDVLWVDRDGKKNEDSFAPQFAAQLRQTIGKADFSLHVVDHSDRTQPTFTPVPMAPIARPTYHSVRQVGLTYVQVMGHLLVKLEAVRRDFPTPVFYDEDEDTEPDIEEIPDHEQIAGGMEYGWTTPGGGDATLLAEGQMIPRLGKRTRRELALFQGDVLLAYRHAFNDEDARELIATLIIDVQTPYEHVAALRYGQRLSDTWNIESSIRSLRLGTLEAQQFALTLTRNF